MLLFAGVVLGLLVGTLRKGSIFRLGRLRGFWAAVLPLASGFLMKAYPAIPLVPKAILISAAYLCVLLFLAANRRYRAAALLLGLGTVGNYLVIALNGFRMPVSPRALEVYAGMTAEMVAAQRADYFVAVDGARLLFLGDMIYMPIRPLDGFLSAGDILIAAGIFLLIVRAMGKNCFSSEKPVRKD